MSDHLTECDRNLGSLVCICKQLRACEARVREEVRQPGRVTLAVEEAYAAGVQAARDAVAAAKAVDISAGHLLDEPRYFVWMHDALAAIDGLRGDA